MQDGCIPTHIHTHLYMIYSEKMSKIHISGVKYTYKKEQERTSCTQNKEVL